jgi:hypothetical protein
MSMTPDARIIRVLAEYGITLQDAARDALLSEIKQREAIAYNAGFRAPPKLGWDGELFRTAACEHKRQAVVTSPTTGYPAPYRMCLDCNANLGPA